MNPSLNVLENEVMRLFTEGDSPEMVVLREQWQQCWAHGRRYTGVGFRIDFRIPRNCRRLDKLSVELDDVSGEVPGLDDDVNFLLFIRHGAIARLEGCAWTGSWLPPSEPCRVHYNLHVGRPGAWAIRNNMGERQWSYVELVLGGR